MFHKGAMYNLKVGKKSTVGDSGCHFIYCYLHQILSDCYKSELLFRGKEPRQLKDQNES